jgi:pimeloyl-ACP methyl ester carboxylesterase
MPTVTTNDGTEIFYKDWGKGQPLFFHHRWPLSADDWDAQMMFFLNHGYRVIAHDRRGHGRSTQTAEGHDMDTYADDAAEVVKKLGLRIPSILGIRREGVRWRDMWRGMARARSPKRPSSAPFPRPS